MGGWGDQLNRKQYKPRRGDTSLSTFPIQRIPIAYAMGYHLTHNVLKIIESLSHSLRYGLSSGTQRVQNH